MVRTPRIWKTPCKKIRNSNTRLPGPSYPITATDIGQANANQLLLQDTSTQVAGRSKSLAQTWFAKHEYKEVTYEIR